MSYEIIKVADNYVESVDTAKTDAEANYKCRTAFQREKDKYNGLGITHVQPAHYEEDGLVTYTGRLMGSSEVSFTAVDEDTADMMLGR